MTEVSALHVIFNGSLHALWRGAALVSGAPGHPPELSPCCSCRGGGPQHGSSASLFTDSLLPQLGTFIL